MRKFECNACSKVRKCIFYSELNEIAGTCPVANSYGADWREVEETVTNCNQLPKLTIEVFDRPECPEWAKYASVNKNGRVIFYVDKNSLGTKADIGFFDASDWENSLIERPKNVKLPDWCKVDSIGYDACCKRYFKVIYIGSNDIDIEYLDNRDGATHCYRESKSWVETRKISFNEHELKKLIGRVVTTLEGDISIVTDYEECGHQVCIYGELYDADELSCSIWLLDGKPCCHLEHKNEKGEWVE